MTTDFISPSSLAQFRLEAETGPTVLLFAGDARRLLALLDAQRAALKQMVMDCYQCKGSGWYKFRSAEGVRMSEPCEVCGQARKLLEIGVEDGE